MAAPPRPMSLSPRYAAAPPRPPKAGAPGVGGVVAEPGAAPSPLPRLSPMTLPAPRRTTRAAFETLTVLAHRDPAGHDRVTGGAVAATARALHVTEPYVRDVLARPDALPSPLRDDVLYQYATHVERGVRTYCRRGDLG